MKRIIIALAVVAVLAAAAVTIVVNTSGDGSVATASGAGKVVPKADVESLAQEDFNYPDDEPDAVNCPSGLPAKKGAMVRCTAVFGKKSQTMEVSAEAVEGDQVTLGYGLLK
jgi:hypothetical protein